MFKLFSILMMVNSLVNASLIRQSEFELRQNGTYFEARFLYDMNYNGKSKTMLVIVTSDNFPGRGDLPTDSELAAKADEYALLDYKDFKAEAVVQKPIKSKKSIASKVVNND